MERLPPLNAVRAFEAAARLASITLAARELSVTPGAVSRQIMALEEFLQTTLLKRGHREISLTADGLVYFKVVTKSIEEIRGVTQRVMDGGERKQLKVRAYTTFAMRWLIPRLSTFHATHPNVEVMLTTSLEMVNFKNEDLDCAIRLGDGNWPGTNAYRLVRNILLPVCSPQLLERQGKPKTHSELGRFSLLHSIARPEDWQHWLDALGIEHGVDPKAGPVYQSSAMVYSSAVEGHGIAMAQQFLVQDDLDAGRLVAPFPETLDMGDYTYYLLTPIDRKESTAMKQFRSWMLEQFSR